MSPARSVLVVDDSPTIRKVVELTLRREGFLVHSAGDALAALAAVVESNPDLILLDIVLPRMDGYQICQVIKRNPIWRHVPVVMLSGRDGIFDKARGRLAGCSGYITKPFDPEELIRVVGRHLGRR